jgi:hypothetical protein
VGLASDEAQADNPTPDLPEFLFFLQIITSGLVKKSRPLSLCYRLSEGTLAHPKV